MIILFIIGFVLFIAAVILYTKAQNISVQKKQQEIQKNRLLDQIESKKQQLQNLAAKKTELAQSLYNDMMDAQKKKEKISSSVQQHMNSQYYALNTKVQQYKHRMTDGMASYEATIQEQYKKIDQRFKQLKQQIAEKIDQYERKLAAHIENEIRQRKIQEDLAFYTIQLSQNEICDILELEKVTRLISKPEVIGKVIWSSYCLPKIGVFETRVLPNKSKVVGIYKITNTKNNMVYIGQSKDVATRWRDHIKCGLGATPAAVGNKLYRSMSQHGIWNFTFQLLQECSEKELNEKEKYWIEQYQSNIIGLNTKGGNK